MAYSIEHKSKADADLDDICEYLSQFYASTPAKFLDEYYGNLDSVAFSPWFRVSDYDPDYRVFNVRDYLVFFKIDENTKTVYIHRILHGARDFSLQGIELMEEQAHYRIYKHIYGPIQSRRLGRSLGVNMVPRKTCSLDCVYCECGATTNLTVERKEYVPADSIIAELDDYLGLISKNSHIPAPDYVSFGGSGEPTLNSGLGKIIKHIKDKFPSQKIALLTNSTLLNDSQLRRDILLCDLILPSLDAVTDKAFQGVNVPEGSIKCVDVINGLTALSSEYKGQIWLEVFISPGINDGDGEIALFKDAITKINPTRVQLNSLDRPGTICTLATASTKSLEEIARKLAPLPVEIVARDR